jgi:hypothetical protein
LSERRIVKLGAENRSATNYALLRRREEAGLGWDGVAKDEQQRKIGSMSSFLVGDNEMSLQSVVPYRDLVLVVPHVASRVAQQGRGAQGPAREPERSQRTGLDSSRLFDFRLSTFDFRLPATITLDPAMVAGSSD